LVLNSSFLMVHAILAICAATGQAGGTDSYGCLDHPRKAIEDIGEPMVNNGFGPAKAQHYAKAQRRRRIKGGGRAPAWSGRAAG
jgi:hypothetical protein